MNTSKITIKTPMLISNILSKPETTNKELVSFGGFNICVFDFNESYMVPSFVILIFRRGLISIANKLKHVTRNKAIATDHIITNSVISAEFKTSIITFPYSLYLTVLLIVPRPGKNSYKNKITQVIQ